MRKRRLLCSLLSLTLIFQWNSQVISAKSQEIPVNESIESISTDGTMGYVKNELLVTYKSDKGKVTHLPTGVKEETITDSCSLFTVKEKEDMFDAIETIATDFDVECIEPNYTVNLLETNDAFSNRQWAYFNPNSNINSEAAWGLGTGENEKVVVAVIDTGIDYQHADLAENIWNNSDEKYLSERDTDENGYPGDYYGWNFSEDSPVICDYQFVTQNGERVAVDMHGTHVAGIINATADNGKGIAGLASYSNVKVMSLKVMEVTEEGITASISKIVKAIKYAQNNGATICNLSLGTSSYSKALYEEMEQSSMLFVCAAGNGEGTISNKGYDISSRPVYPASYKLDNIISVANANSSGTLDETSCFSKTEVDIAAPGTDIASCYVDEKHTENGKYILSTGTSMSAPFVSATAAMLSSYYGDLSPVELKKMILGGSKKVEALSSKVVGGSYLDVYGAMTYDGLLASLTTNINDIKKSNNKNYVINVNNPLSEDLTILYAKGKKNTDYFEEEENGTLLKTKDEKATIKIKKTSYYTIYLKDSSGNAVIYTDKVVVPKLEKIKTTVTKKTLHIADTYRLKVKLYDSDVYAKVTYKSSNKKIVKVSSHGNVRAVKKGTAIITVTATYGTVKKTTTCKIVVK